MKRLASRGMILALLLTGCGKQDATIEQQRTFVRTLRTQQETQAALDKREKELRDREKSQEDRLREIAGREASLRDQEKKQQDTLERFAPERRP